MQWDLQWIGLGIRSGSASQPVVDFIYRTWDWLQTPPGLSLLMVVLTAVIMFLTIAVVVYACKTLRATRESLRASKESLDFFLKPTYWFDRLSDEEYLELGKRAHLVLGNGSPLPITVRRDEDVQVRILHESCSEGIGPDTLKVNTDHPKNPDGGQTCWPFIVNRQLRFGFSLDENPNQPLPSSKDGRWQIVIQAEVKCVYRAREQLLRSEPMEFELHKG